MRTPLAGLLLLLACGPKPASTPPSSEPPAATAATPAATPEATDASATPDDGATAPASGDDPRISRSAGEEGGVVVLWPRVNPADQADATSEIAGMVQVHMKAVAEKALPGRPLDVRPEPERTCPRAGCKGVALGTLLVRKGDACVAVAFVMPPGIENPTKLVPWSEGVTLKHPEIDFRGYPESEVTVTDFGSCADLTKAMAKHDAAVVKLLKAAAG